MSPTLLEGLVALILVIVAWQIGTEIAPLILRTLRRAIDQVDQGNSDTATLDQTPLEKEQEDAKHESR